MRNTNIKLIQAFCKFHNKTEPLYMQYNDAEIEAILEYIINETSQPQTH